MSQKDSVAGSKRGGDKFCCAAASQLLRPSQVVPQMKPRQKMSMSLHGRVVALEWEGQW